MVVCITRLLLRMIIDKLTCTIDEVNYSPLTNSSIRDYSSIQQSDIAPFGRAAAVWINGTEPVVEYEAGTPGPNRTFPYTRLASVTLADYSFTFLYHQINSTTLLKSSGTMMHRSGLVVHSTSLYRILSWQLQEHEVQQGCFDASLIS